MRAKTKPNAPPLAKAAAAVFFGLPLLLPVLLPLWLWAQLWHGLAALKRRRMMLWVAAACALVATQYGRPMLDAVVRDAPRPFGLTVAQDVALRLLHESAGWGLRLDGLQSTVDAFWTHHFETNWPLAVFGSYGLYVLAAGAWSIPVIAFWTWRSERKAPDETTHGTARFGDEKHARDRQHLRRKSQTGFGVALGRFQQKVPRKTDARFRVGGHILTCAPTGAGKGIGAVIPNLLEYKSAVVCLDVKGENFAVTARRRRELGFGVFALDPFGITRGTGPSDVIRGGFNPLQHLNLADKECVSEAVVLAEALVVREGRSDPHWNDSAEALLQGLILYVASLEARRRHLGTVRDILTADVATQAALFATMGQDDALAFGVVAKTARTHLARADREQSGVLSTAIRHTRFLDDPRLVDALSQNDLDWTRLQDDRPSVFIVLPPDKLTGPAVRFARLAIGQAIRSVMTRRGEKNRVLFLLDEFVQLEHFPLIENGVSILRGYGARLWLLVQDLSQLEATYPRWRTFLANCTLQAFGTQDQRTAKYLSEAMGMTTVRFETHSESENQVSGYETRTSASVGEQRQGRPLMMPDEIRRLPDDIALVLARGARPFALRRLNYLQDRETAGLFEANPMHGALSRRRAVRGRSGVKLRSWNETRISQMPPSEHSVHVALSFWNTDVAAMGRRHPRHADRRWARSLTRKGLSPKLNLW